MTNIKKLLNRTLPPDGKMKKRSIWSFLPAELETAVIESGEKKFRAHQLLNWIYQHEIIDISQMINISKGCRQLFDQQFSTTLPEISEIQKSKDGTRKYLLQLVDNNYIEMVLIPTEDKLTLCISSQVGCRFGCSFCATSQLGLIRNLEVEEITTEVYLARQQAKPNKITNLVFMGMGEPLDNLENVIKAIRILQAEKCFAFSPRRITVSTCGIVPGILELAKSGLKIKLAVSLNSAIDEKRAKLMPVSRIYPIAQLKSALIQFSKATTFRITIEYVMIRDFNLGAEDLKALRKFSGDLSSKINIIPWNPIPGKNWEKPDSKEIEIFMLELYKSSTVPITLRNSRGGDISAACGMLAGKKREVPPVDGTS